MYRWFAWNIVFRVQEMAKGHPTFAILREMEAADRLSLAELEALRSKRLRSFIEYCYAHVPYVRSRMQAAGVQPAQICEARDLGLLPLMTKADVRTHRESLRSDLGGKLAPFTTGGSTGEPLVFDLSKRRVASRVACRQRVAKWWGLSVGDPELAFWGSPIEATRQDWVRGLRDKLLASQLLSAFEMNGARIFQYLDVLERRGCRQIFGYPSAIYLLCVQARKERRNLRRLGVKAIFVTGEVLYPYQRELIAETFNAPVANGYGGRESGFISHECPQGGMHSMADAVILEVVDDLGRPVPQGEPGEIVVTDLYSEQAPFIRYATGDRAVMSARPCPCGRALPLIERIEGRSNDSIVAPDGRIINSLAVVYPVREVEGIEQFRICQKTVDRFHIQIVRNDRFSIDGEDRIRKGWTQLMRAPLDITFEYLPEFPAERSGKFRHVVSELPQGTTVREIEQNYAL
jgi:phenylacetate-CoA ligase